MLDFTALTLSSFNFTDDAQAELVRTFDLLERSGRKIWSSTEEFDDLGNQACFTGLLSKAFGGMNLGILHGRYASCKGWRRIGSPIRKELK